MNERPATTPAQSSRPESDEASRASCPLPTERAFVVRFQAPRVGEEPSFAGRVEHVASGEEARFHSVEELVRTLARVLAMNLESTHPEAGKRQR